MSENIILKSQDVENCCIFIGPSLNKEISAGISTEFLKEIIKPFPGIIYGQKNIVRRIEESSVMPGKQRFTITLESGGQVEFIIENHLEAAAGTAVNIAEVFLQEFVIKDVGIYGAIGEGTRGRFIRKTLEDHGFRLFLFRRKHTASTLSLQDDEGMATLFCEKPSYDLSKGTLEELASVQPRILISSSIRPEDLCLTETLFSQLRKETIKVFVPHIELLRRLELHEQVKKILSSASIVQMNEMEAKILLGVESFEKGMIKKFGEYKVPVFIITLGAEGSVTLFNGTDVVDQPGFKVNAPKDTTGAGDVHLATFIYFYVLRENKPPREICLQMASWVASHKVEKQGPYCGLPPKEERREKLREFWPESQK